MSEKEQKETQTNEEQTSEETTSSPTNVGLDGTVNADDDSVCSSKESKQDKKKHKSKKITIRTFFNSKTLCLVLVIINLTLIITIADQQNEIQAWEDDFYNLQTNQTNWKTSCESISSQLTKIKAEYASYKEKMQPYEKIAEAELNKKLEEVKKEEEAKRKKEEEERRKAAEEQKRKAQEEQRKKEEEEKRGYETGITYDNLARTPDKYIGEKVKFSGTVLQVLEDDDIVEIRLAVNDNYDTVIIADFSKDLIKNNRILEDDHITILGNSIGVIDYKTVLGNKLTVPAVTVDKIIR